MLDNKGREINTEGLNNAEREALIAELRAGQKPPNTETAEHLEKRPKTTEVISPLSETKVADVNEAPQPTVVERIDADITKEVTGGTGTERLGSMLGILQGEDIIDKHGNPIVNIRALQNRVNNPPPEDSENIDLKKAA